MSKVLTVLVLSLGVATAANAGSSRPHSTYGVSHQTQGVTTNATGASTSATADAAPAAAPEIDPASAISALTLLAGGLAVVRGRRSVLKRV